MTRLNTYSDDSQRLRKVTATRQSKAPWPAVELCELYVGCHVILHLEAHARLSAAKKSYLLSIKLSYQR